MRRKEKNIIVKREERNMTITLRRDMRNVIMNREKMVERRCSDQIVAIVNQLFCL